MCNIPALGKDGTHFCEWGAMREEMHVDRKIFV